MIGFVVLYIPTTRHKLEQLCRRVINNETTRGRIRDRMAACYAGPTHSSCCAKVGNGTCHILRKVWWGLGGTCNRKFVSLAWPGTETNIQADGCPLDRGAGFTTYCSLEVGQEVGAGNTKGLICRMSSGRHARQARLCRCSMRLAVEERPEVRAHREDGRRRTVRSP